MPITTISPAQARAMIDGGARLVDIRDRDEHAREHIPGALNVPVADISHLPAEEGPVIFHCRSGMRTAACAQQLAAAAGDVPAYVLDGGIDGWRRAGQQVLADRSQPLGIMRQVQIAAGSLVLAGVLAGLFIAPAFFGLSAFVGAGLLFAGTTGWCGMATLLRAMPWNRRAAS